MHFRLVARVQHLRVELMNLCLTRCLLRHLILHCDLSISGCVSAFLHSSHNVTSRSWAMLDACCSRSCDILRVCASSCNCLSLSLSLSLVHYFSVGIPVRSFAVSPQGSVPERCWIYTSLGVLPLLVSMELEIVYQWFLVLQWHVEQLLRIFDIVFVPFRLPLWISIFRFTAE